MAIPAPMVSSALPSVLIIHLLHLVSSVGSSNYIPSLPLISESRAHGNSTTPVDSHLSSSQCTNLWPGLPPTMCFSINSESLAVKYVLVLKTFESVVRLTVARTGDRRGCPGFLACIAFLPPFLHQVSENWSLIQSVNSGAILDRGS